VIIIYRKKRGGLLLPVLATAPQGHNTGGAISAGAAGFAILVDRNGSGTIPALIDGSWTSIATQAYSTTVAARLSYKVVTNGESIDPVGTSRCQVRIYTNVDAADPIDDSDVTSGTDDFILPAMTISTGGRLCVGWICRVGTGTAPWTAPLGSNAADVNTTAVTTSAESAGLLTTFAGLTMSDGSPDHVGFVIALNGAAG
jgi:hypothetical protein